MKVSKLIESLQEVEKEHGDIQVTVFADHGQTECRAVHTSIEYLGEDGEAYCLQDINETFFSIEDYDVVVSIYGE
jgi:hypothetical protein